MISSPFGGTPTTVQISTAASSTLGYLSEELPTIFAQSFSITSHGIQSSPTMPEEDKTILLATLDKIQELFWATGIMANLATCSAWTDPNPKDMPGCQKNDPWFYDGGYTDGPAVGLALARYQEAYGTSGEVKLIISNNNYETDNMNNVLGYFATSWNEGVAPGDFIWSPGVGSGPQKNPWQSTQIFEEYLDADTIKAAFEPVTGTNLTMAFINGSTVSNPAFGVQGGQKISLAILNINSDIPTFLVTEPVITAYTPNLVDLVEAIASSQDLAEKIRTFTNVETSSDTSSASSVIPLTFSLSSLALLFLSQAY